MSETSDRLDIRTVAGLVPARPADAHKGRFGHLLVLAGSPGFTGAAALVCESALRSGAGLVTLGIPEPLAPVMEVKTTEAMTLALPATSAGTLAQGARSGIETFLSRATALAVGPGISTNTETAALVRGLLPAVEVPQVIDADGLTCLCMDGQGVSGLPPDTVLTPHPGEMSRLTGIPTKEIQSRREEVALRFAVEWGVVVALKGYQTVVASPDGAVAVIATGNSGMATGGTGDVLTGIIGGLLAQGMSPWDAVRLGVYLHGLAGDIAADAFTPQAMIAGDMVGCMADAWRQLVGER